MSQVPGPRTQVSDPSARRSAVGGAVVVVLVAAVAGWLQTQRPQPPSAVSTASGAFPTGASARAGFRPDAWFLPDDDLLGFVEIPAGPFSMGSDPAHDPMLFDNERWAPSGGVGQVDLPLYYIGRYEVTVAQFSHFAQATGFRVDDRALSGPADHPVVAVSWPDALGVLPMARGDPGGLVVDAASAAPAHQRRLARDSTDRSGVGKGRTRNRWPYFPVGR